MSNFVFNIAKGTVREKALKGAPLKMLILQAASAEAVLKDLDSVAAVLADAGTDEADFTNYARATLVNVTDTVDDTSDSVSVTANDVVFASAGGATNNTTVAVVLFDDVDGTDANAIPLVHLDAVFTTDGNQLTIKFANGGFFGAS
ncbi:MAG: hypothetical protein AAFX06_28290 [Planctomycetota bacterium]